MGFCHPRTDVHVGRNASEPDEFAGIEADIRRLQQSRGRRIAVDDSHLRAVRRRDFVDMIGGEQSAGARRALDDDPWIAGYVLAEMRCKQPRISIIPAAGAAAVKIVMVLP